MSDKLTVTIVGSNGVSRVFQEVVNDAQKMGTGIERSSQMADQAMQGVGRSATQMAEQVETSNATAGASAEKIGKAIGNAGLAFGAFSLIAGKAAGDSEASAARLSTSFQNANLDIAEYQGQINQLNATGLKLAFDDEDVQDALARLITTTGDVTKSFNDVKLAEDIARGTGKSLADATGLVVQAEAGRFRGLAQLGIVLDSTATKEDYLAAAQAKFAGQADAYATTNAASFDRYKNSAENALEAIGGKLEGLQMPILAVATAATALGPMVGTLKEIANAEKVAELGGVAMDLALGPVGLAAAALAAGAGIYYLVTQSNDYVSAGQAAVGVTNDLTNMLVQLEAASSPQNALVLQSLEKQITAFIDYAGTAQDRVSGLSDLASRMGQGANSLDLLNAAQVQTAEDITKMTEAQLTALDANHDTIVTYQEMEDALNNVSTAVSGAAGLMQSLTTPQLDKFSEDFANFMALPNLNIPKAAQAVADLITQFQSGALTADQFVAGMDDLLVHTKPYIDVTHASTAALATNTTAINTNGQAIAAQMGAYAAVNQSLDQSIRIAQRSTEATVSNGQAIANQMAAYESQNDSLERAIEFQQKQSDWLKTTTKDSIAYQSALVGDASALAQIAQSQGSVALPASQLTDAVKQQIQAMKDDATATQAASSAIADYRQRLDEVHMVVNDGSNQFAKHATIAGNALDNGNRVVVGNTNAMAQQSQGVSDWATNLIGAQGTLAKIDDLQARGVINQDEYNAAQAAGTSIFAANAAIQDDILKIQTDQAPLMAKLTENQQHYMDQLAQMPADQQLVELGYMDSAESAKALADQQLLLSAVSGELGDKGVETAERMIRASAEADPVLAAMLQDMGMITIGADGTITVNTDSVKAGKSDTDRLIDAVTTLADELAQIFGITVDHGSVTLADTAVGYLHDHVNDLDGTSAIIDAGVNDGATGTLEGIAQLVDALNGKTAFVTVYQNTVGSFQGVQSTMAGLAGRLGGVMGYAGGGVVARMGEAGPEMLTFPNGHTGLAMTDGLYNVPRGTYVDTAPATKGKVGLGGMTFHGANFNFYGLTSRDQVTQQINEFALGGSR